LRVGGCVSGFEGDGDQVACVKCWIQPFDATEGCWNQLPPQQQGGYHDDPA
jgi:hypothetical protein